LAETSVAGFVTELDQVNKKWLEVPTRDPHEERRPRPKMPGADL
jgi:hypothetical protein